MVQAQYCEQHHTTALLPLDLPPKKKKRKNLCTLTIASGAGTNHQKKDWYRGAEQKEAHKFSGCSHDHNDACRVGLSAASSSSLDCRSASVITSAN